MFRSLLINYEAKKEANQKDTSMQVQDLYKETKIKYPDLDLPWIHLVDETPKSSPNDVLEINGIITQNDYEKINKMLAQVLLSEKNTNCLFFPVSNEERKVLQAIGSETLKLMGIIIGKQNDMVVDGADCISINVPAYNGWLQLEALSGTYIERPNTPIYPSPSTLFSIPMGTFVDPQAENLQSIRDFFKN